MRTILVVVLAGALAAGCARNTTKAYNTWVGVSIDSLINKWGAPDRVYTLPNGDKTVTYSVYGGVHGNAYGVSSSSCEVEWRAVGGIIKSVRWSGGAGFCGNVINKRGRGPNT